MDLSDLINLTNTDFFSYIETQTANNLTFFFIVFRFNEYREMDLSVKQEQPPCLTLFN